MSFYDAIRVGASGAADFEVERSLRFNDNDSPRINRTPSSAGNRKTWTKSFWIKRGQISRYFITAYYISGTDVAAIEFGSNDDLHFYDFYNGYRLHLVTTQKFRDPSAWYHIVIALDTTQSTASDRVKIYVNGEQVTSFSTATYPSQNLDVSFNQNVLEAWGTEGTNQRLHFDGYMSEITYIDGLQLTPSSFGETNATTGQWNPIDTSGLTYGTNGYRLQFADNSGTTATTLGKDSSGNGNNWTPVNFSVSAGAGNDSVSDTPTNNFPTFNPLCENNDNTYSEGNLKATFYANSQSGIVTSMASPKSGKWYWEVRPLNDYLFIGVTADTYQGTGNVISATNTGGSTVAYYSSGDKYVGGSSSTYNNQSYTNGDLIGVALDMDNGQVTFYKNNSSQGAISLVSTEGHLGVGAVGTGQSLSMSINFGQQAFSYTPPTGFVALCSANLPDPTILLPNKHFDTTLYTGNGSTGQSITSLQFQPDWLWFKRRSQSGNHGVNDSVRGRAKGVYPDAQNAEFTDDAGRGLVSFDANGFTVGDTQNLGAHNKNGETIVNWAWNAGETDSATYRVVVVSDSGNKYRFRNSANTATFAQSAVTLDLAEGGTYIFNMDDGTNATHPFSIGTAANGTVYTSGITYFLDGVSKTYSQYTSGFAAATTRRLHITVPASAPVLYYWCSAHSGMGGQINTNSTLGSSNFDGSIQSTAKANTTSGFSIVGYTGTNGTGTIGHGLGVAPRAYIVKRRDNASDWRVYHQSLGNTNALKLNTNDQAYANSGYWNDTSPTSTTVSLGNDSDMNGSTDKYIAYCFSEVAGYSKFGKYTGNGNADGSFVFTGFRPAFVIIKRTDASNDWFIQDDKRLGYNPANSYLEANTALAEQAETDIDILSNGFKCRSTGNGHNASGGTYIYLAFAESPFKNSRAR